MSEAQTLIVYGPDQVLTHELITHARALGFHVAFGFDGWCTTSRGELEAAYREPLGCATYVASNVSTEDAIDDFVDQVDGLSGDLRGLVMVQGPTSTQDFLSMSEASWRAGVEERLSLPFFWSRRVVEEFLAGGGGGFVVQVTPRPNPRDVLATAVHAGMLPMLRSLTKEYGKRSIHANHLSYGAHEGARRAVVEAALFLCSERAGFVNGETVEVG